MPNRSSSKSGAGRRKSASVTTVIGAEKRHGREAWRVASDGRQRVLVTSPTSAAAMDQAMILYGRALRRLADR